MCFGTCVSLGLYVHLSCWQSDIHLQCGSHICSMVCAKYVYSETGSGSLAVILGGDSAWLLLRSAQTELIKSVELCSEDGLRMAGC